MAVANPWYGDKHIAVMCRRAGAAVNDREAYIVDEAAPGGVIAARLLGERGGEL